MDGLRVEGLGTCKSLFDGQATKASSRIGQSPLQSRHRFLLLCRPCTHISRRLLSRRPRIIAPVLSLFPSSRGLKVTWSSVVKIGQSLYREGPGKDPFRPDERTPVKNFFLAGSYTKQDYIDSMEGATLSGRQASAYIRDAGEELTELRTAFAVVEKEKVGAATNTSVALLVVGREVSADCLSDCFPDCIGYESTICTLKCYYKCKWTEKKQVDALVEKLTPQQKALLREIEKGKANKEPESNTSRKLKAAMKF